MAAPTPQIRFSKRFARWVRKKSLMQAVAALAVELTGNPTAGDVIPRSGGLRKVRLAGEGKGKSGGFRVIYTVVIDSTWLVVLDGYSKSDQEDLSADELKALVKLAGEVEADLRAEAAASDTEE